MESPESEDPYDSRQYGENFDFWNEKEFVGLNEKIPRGPEAISIDFTVNQAKESFIFGLPERPVGKTLLENTTDWDPYRVWNADHYDRHMDRHSMYGTVPMV